MRKFFKQFLSLPLAIVILASLTTGGVLAARQQAVAVDPEVQVMLNQVSTEVIYNYTAQLSGEQPVTVGGTPYTFTTRYTYSGEPIRKAGQFVGEHLQALGMNVEYHTWDSADKNSNYPNVIGQITGVANPTVIYMIGAHLDDKPISGLAPGADDNASGVVGTLIAADILSQYQWNCTLRFAFWTGEEQGMLGSMAYATRARSQSANIKGYLNLDMISYNSRSPNDIDLFARSSVPGSVEMMNLFSDVVSAYGMDLAPVKYTNNTESNYSDNRRFWDQNYASIWVAESDYLAGTVPYNHHSTDTLATLDMAYYTEAVKASLATFVHLSGCLVAGPGPTTTYTPTQTITSTATGTVTPTVTLDGTATNTPTDTAAPENTSTNTATSTNTKTSTPTSTKTPGGTATSTPTATNTFTRTPTLITSQTNTPTKTPTKTSTATRTPTGTPSRTMTNTPLPGARIYLGSSTYGTAGDIAFDDEDILIKNMTNGVWSMFINGSRIGLTYTNVDAFELQSDGSMLMSFDSDFTLDGFGAVDDSDILRFTPTSTGTDTTGSWSWYFDGSDVGLTTANEDVDAFTIAPDGKLIISTVGAFTVTGASGQDEDLLAFTSASLGEATGGTWALYFDGSDVGLASNNTEDVNGVWIDSAGKVYLTTLGKFSVTGLSGDGSDIFTCTPGSLGSTTTCAWSMFWDGSANGFAGEDTDSFSIRP